MGTPDEERQKIETAQREDIRAKTATIKVEAQKKERPRYSRRGNGDRGLSEATITSQEAVTPAPVPEPSPSYRELLAKPRIGKKQKLQIVGKEIIRLRKAGLAVPASLLRLKERFKPDKKRRKKDKPTTPGERITAALGETTWGSTIKKKKEEHEASKSSSGGVPPPPPPGTPAPPKKGEKASPEYVKYLEKAPPPQLQVAREFKVHPDWTVAENDAKGKPSVYVDEKGIRYYVPGTAMYDMGYATSLEYLGYRTTVQDLETGRIKAVWVGGGAKKDNPKSVAPWVAWTNAKGEPILVPKAEIIRISKLGEEEQVAVLRRLGIMSEEKLPLSASKALKIRERQALALEGIISTRKIWNITNALKKPYLTEEEAIKGDFSAYHEAVRIPLSGAVSQERYLKELEQYSKEVKQFNLEVKNLDESFDWIEVQAERLEPKLDLIDKQNKLVEELEAEANTLSLLSSAINPFNVEQVEEYNKRIARFNTKLANFEVPEKEIQSILKELDHYNDQVASLNLRYDKLNIPEEPPAPKEDLGSFVVKAWHSTKQNFKEATAKHLTTAEKVKNVSGLVAEMVVPGLWARHWNQLGWGERGFNIAMDILILIPLIKLGSIGLKAITRQTGTATIKQFLKLEKGYTDFLVNKLKPRYGKAVANQFKLISATQSRYLRQLIKLDRLKIKKTANRRIRAQEKMVRKTKTDLEQQARQFVDEIKLQKQGGVPGGWAFDDPRVAEAFTRLPKEIAAHTENIASSLVPKKGNIKALKAALFSAEQRLKAAQAKKGAWKDSSQFADLIEDVMLKQVKLNQALASSIEEIQRELLKIQSLLKRSKLTKAELKAQSGELKRAIAKLQTEATQPWLSAKQKGLLRTKIKNLRLELSHLPKAKPARLTFKQRATLKTRGEELTTKLDQAIKDMEVEWSRSGSLRRGRPLGDYPTPPPSGRSTGLSQAIKQMELEGRRLPATKPLPSGAAIVGPRAFVGASTAVLAKTLTKTDLELVMGRITDPEEEEAIAAETLRAIKTAVGLKQKGLTKAEIQAKVREQLKASLKPHLLPSIKTALKTKGITKAQVKAMTKVQVKAITKAALKVATATKTPAKVKPAKPLPKPKPVLSSDSSDEEKREFIKQTPGAVTWNMGKLGEENPQDVWHVRLPDGKHIVVIGKAPKGAEILADGPGSAYKTAQVTGEKRRAFPKFRQKHGAVTATLQPAKIAKGARISFSPSPGLQSKRKGRMFETKLGSSTGYSRHRVGRGRKR